MEKILLVLDETVLCGGVELPTGTINLISIGITILQVAVPLILIIMGMLDFVKATTSSKEDEIKKAQSTFIRRLIMGAAVFLVILIVKIVVGLLPNTDGELDCIKLIFGATESISNGAPSDEVGDLLHQCGDPSKDVDPDACRCEVCKAYPNDNYCKKNVDAYCKYSESQGVPSDEVGNLLNQCGDPSKGVDPDACRCEVCKAHPNDNYCKKNVDAYCKNARANSNE